MPKDFWIHYILNVLFQVDRKQSPLFPAFVEANGDNSKSDNLSFPSCLDINYDKCKNTAQLPTHLNLLQPRHLPADQ